MTVEPEFQYTCDLSRMCRLARTLYETLDALEHVAAGGTDWPGISSLSAQDLAKTLLMWTQPCQFIQLDREQSLLTVWREGYDFKQGLQELYTDANNRLATAMEEKRKAIMER